MTNTLSSVRLVLATMVICVGVYVTLIWGAAQVFWPSQAQGSMITSSDGKIVGSRLIAQSFNGPKYFWPRPSAVDYNASAAAGSNKSPTSPDLTKRAAETTARYGATESRRLPADLAAASGAGLDPHITKAAAVFQAPRVAEARGLPLDAVRAAIRDAAFSPGHAFTQDELVNVLELNLALDGTLPEN
jgi:K+-transporting ATPase ATPase C chain